MARPRDRRRFGPGPYLLGLRRLKSARGSPSRCRRSSRWSACAALEGTHEPVLSATKPRTGYFLRAESFFNIPRFVDGGSTFSPDVSLYGGTPLHEQSHGESFLTLAANRFAGEGLYILDEPEAALSVSGALALMSVIARAAAAGAQFVIATHSPILLACPGAQIYELSTAGIAPCEYDDLDGVRITRGFLEAPERYLRAALDELEAG